MPTTNMITKCNEAQNVNRAFQEKGVTGNSTLISLQGIGPMIAGLAYDHNLTTINDLLRAAHNLKSVPNVDRLLESCTFNGRRGTCVQRNNKPKYHVPDVNVCGYNTLLATLKFALHHPDRYSFPTHINLAFIRNMKPRQRGKYHGSRYCSCIKDRNTCRIHGAECEWKQTLKLCLPQGTRADAGFRGKRRVTSDHRLPQKINQDGTVVLDGKLYRGKWRQPTNINPQLPTSDEPAQSVHLAQPTRSQAAQPAESVQPAQPTRSRRIQGGKTHSKLTKEQLKLWDCELFSQELCQPHLSRSSRQFRNFLRLTNDI